MHHKHPLILFIIKKSFNYHCGKEVQISSGLRTSALFVVDLLLSDGYRAKLVEAVDGNSVDALIAQNSPSRVVIEAIWVTPTKLAELMKRYPKVKWTVRIHSETPFLAQEGMAIAWLAQYMKMGVEVAFNSLNTVDDFQVLGKASYLPNYYPLRKPRTFVPIDGQLNVGCFGAVRPLKNQLIQAFGAIQFAKKVHKKLFFHMNGTRVEQMGSNNLKNIQALFDATGETLVLNPWQDHEDFLELVAQMDICLQVSLTESFCIVASDAVSMGVPLIGSSAIKWLPQRSQAVVDSADSIAAAMGRADLTMVLMNNIALSTYLQQVRRIWAEWAA